MWWILVGVLADRLDYKDFDIAKLNQYVAKTLLQSITIRQQNNDFGALFQEYGQSGKILQ